MSSSSSGGGRGSDDINFDEDARDERPLLDRMVEHFEEESKAQERYLAEMEELPVPNGFQLTDQPGHADVVMTRKFELSADSFERVVISFNMNQPNPATNIEDLMQAGEELEAEGAAEEERRLRQQEDLDDDEDGQDGMLGQEIGERPSDVDLSNHRMEFTVQVTKGATGPTIVFNCSVDLMDEWYIDSCSIFPSSKIPDDRSVSGEWIRQHVFETLLDEHINVDTLDFLYDYLEERGVDEELVQFLGAYMGFKMDKEQLRWHLNMVKFLKSA